MRAQSLPAAAALGVPGLNSRCGGFLHKCPSMWDHRAGGAYIHPPRHTHALSALLSPACSQTCPRLALQPGCDSLLALPAPQTHKGSLDAHPAGQHPFPAGPGSSDHFHLKPLRKPCTVSRPQSQHQLTGDVCASPSGAGRKRCTWRSLQKPELGSLERGRLLGRGACPRPHPSASAILWGLVP